MAITNPLGPQTKPENAGPITRTVAADMSAIFGSSERVTGSTRSTGRSASTRSIMPRRVILAISAGTLAATIAAGIYAGNSVIVAPAVTPPTRVGYRVPRVVAEGRELGSLPVAARTSVAGPVPPPLVPVGAPISVSEPSQETIAPVTAVEPPPLPRAVSPAVVPVVRRPSPTTALSSAASMPATARRSGCDDDSEECLGPRIDIAEQRVARAFEQAERAGVRRRDLRGYRGEWDRARREVAEQPRYALRLYAMITSDLYTLADDAEARDGETTR